MSTLLACVSRVTLGHPHVVEVDVQSAAYARGADRHPLALASSVDPPPDRRLRDPDESCRVGVGGPLLHQPSRSSRQVSDQSIHPFSLRVVVLPQCPHVGSDAAEVGRQAFVDGTRHVRVEAEP